MPPGANLAFHDLAPSEENFRDAVLAGLGRTPKELPCKLFYDARGSALFEEICEAPEYYLTRTEIAILETRAKDIAAHIGPHCRLIELGSGASRKVRILLGALDRPAAYVPLDISRERLHEAADALAVDFPGLTVVAVCADYTQPLTLPPLPGPDGKRVGFFPGSTIGNFEPQDAAEFLRQAGRILGQGATIIVGVDRIKDVAVLNAAYDDAAGVTAKFNLNVLTRMNRELGGNFDLAKFTHHAFYNADNHRIEMHLVSLEDQSVSVAGRTFDFRKGETIHTENSYKYTVESFRALAASAGWRPVATWTDENDYFAVHALKI
jgi:dimethylhistidine N-methyltransferase